MLSNRRNNGIFIIIFLLIWSKYLFLESGYSLNDNFHWPTKKWLNGDPNDFNLDGSIINNMINELENTSTPVEHITLSKNGYMLAKYFDTGRDQNFTFYHVVKGITAILTGIAIDKGILQSVDVPILSFFNMSEIQNIDNEKESITLKHLLTSTSGINWDEDSTSYSDPDNDFNIWRDSRNWGDFILDRRMVAEPGTSFKYNSATTHLLNCILAKQINTSILDFTIQYLFDPLGINVGVWTRDPQGIQDGASGIHIGGHDLAKIGLMLLNNGTWDGQQILSSQYVEDMFTDHFNVGYGYQFWLEDAATHGENVWTCAGPFDAKKLTILFEPQLVTTITCDRSSEWSKRLLTDFIIPAASEKSQFTFGFTYIPLLITLIIGIVIKKRGLY